MISAGITVKGPLLTNAAGVQREFMTAEERGVARCSLMTNRELKLQMSGAKVRDPFWGIRGAQGDFLGSRSGTSRKSLSPGGIVHRIGNKVTSAVGSPEKHVAFLEEGGTRSGKYKRIPTAAAQHASGVDINLGRSIRGLNDYFLFRSANGHHLWAAKRTGRGDMVLMYLLVRNTVTRGRHVFKTVRDRMEPRVREICGREVSLAVAKVN